MKKSICFGSVVALALTAALVPAAAKDFPLEFKTIKPQDVMSFPGGYGTFGNLQVVKPPGIKKEPKAVSRHPLYGQFGGETGSKPLLYRLDESSGEGKGYDELIVDMNRNGDLTDDAATKAAKGANARQAMPPGGEHWLAGPIVAPADQMNGKWKPIYFAEVNIFNRQGIGRGISAQSTFIGQLRLKAGWYLEALVETDGIKQKVGVVDGNSNLRLGDRWKPVTYRTSTGENWYFAAGDSFLQDTDGSGNYENNPFNTESSPFSPILYFGATPYKVTLASDYKSIQVEPWSEALAELEVTPQGAQVRSISLGWEHTPGQWQLIKPGVANGKAQVPPGNYRLYSCVLAGKAGTRESLTAGGENRNPCEPLTLKPGKTAVLRCGAPMEIKVTAQRESLERAAPPADSRSDAAYALRINAQVIGAGGEVYSIYAKGEDLRGMPPKPTFTIVDGAGKQVHSGDLEFG